MTQMSPCFAEAFAAIHAGMDSGASIVRAAHPSRLVHLRPDPSRLVRVRPSPCATSAIAHAAVAPVQHAVENRGAFPSRADALGILCDTAEALLDLIDRELRAQGMDTTDLFDLSPVAYTTLLADANHLRRRPLTP